MTSKGHVRGAAQSESERRPYFRTGNEVVDVFLPIMGSDCFAVYSVFRKRAFSNPKLRHTVDDLAETINRGGTTVSRALQILEHLKLAQLIRRRGSQASECVLLDSWDAAKLLGVTYNCENHSYVLPSEVNERLMREIQAIRDRQQGKPTVDSAKRGSIASSEARQRFSENRQRSTRETQMGTHLLQKEERTKEHPSPTPSHNGETDNDESSPDEDEPHELMKYATNQFTGVIDELRAALLSTDMPPVPHLANGYEDWERFGFAHLAVEGAARSGLKLKLVISAPDPAATLEGLKKYRQRWQHSLMTWFRFAVEFELIESPQDSTQASTETRNGG